MVSESIHTPPMVGHWKFLGEVGGQNAKLLGEKYEAKLEFPRGEGCKTKNLL